MIQKGCMQRYVCNSTTSAKYWKIRPLLRKAICGESACGMGTEPNLLQFLYVYTEGQWPPKDGVFILYSYFLLLWALCRTQEAVTGSHSNPVYSNVQLLLLFNIYAMCNFLCADVYAVYNRVALGIICNPENCEINPNPCGWGRIWLPILWRRITQQWLK
jgi:hypothetical protein